MVALRKQARPDLAIRGQPNPAAVPAERMRNRSDDADLAQAIVEGEASRGLTQRVRGEIHQWSNSVQPLDDLLQGNDRLMLPAAVFLQRHPLDEAHDDVLATAE